MACSEDLVGERRCAVTIVDDEIPQAGWQELDLGRTVGLAVPPDPSARPGPADGSSPVGNLRLGAGVSAAFDAALTGRLGRRVPAAAFVAIGAPTRRATGPKVAATRPAGRRVANDNKASGDGHSVWRDLFFLAILVATVAGAFWTGRVQGYQKVIVVPGPSSFHSVVT